MTVRDTTGRDTLPRALVALGALAGLVAVLVAVVVGLGRGYRSGGSTTVLVAAAVLAVVLVGVGLVGVGLVRAGGASVPRPLRLSALVLAVLAVLGALIVVLTVSPRPRMGSVVFDAVDREADLVLRTPTGVEEGDVLVAQLYHRGPGEVRAPAGWVPVRTTTLAAGGLDTVTVFAREVTDDEPPAAAFSTDSPDGKVGGISAWSDVDGADGVTLRAERTGAGGPLTAPAVDPDSGQAPLLYLAAATGATRLTPSPALTEIWQARSDGLFKGTVHFSVRPPDGDDAAALAVDAAPEATAGWAVQVLELEPR